MSSEYSIEKSDSKRLFVSFGGYALKMGNITQFEFLNFLQTHFDDSSAIFYIDKNRCCYHKGICGISTTIEETKEYLQNKIKKYTQVIFLGVSSGAYAAILFGSLLNVTTVIAFIPPTKLHGIDKNQKYCCLTPFINKSTHYFLYGDTSVKDSSDPHHISHCERIDIYPNVHIFKKEKVVLPEMKRSGELLKILQLHS
jgi:hypothetical protein